MPIVKHIQKQDYTVVDNACLRDPNLDLGCRGLLVTMISLPENWDFSSRGLTSIMPCGRNKILKLLRKIEEAGYLRREEIRDDKGRIADVIYYIAATPMFAENPTEENSADKTKKFERDFTENLNVSSQRKCENHPGNNEGKCVENFSNNDCAKIDYDISTEVLQDTAEEISTVNSDDAILQNKENSRTQPWFTNPTMEYPTTENETNNKIYNNKLNTNKLYIDQESNNQSINLSNQDLLNYDSLNDNSVNRLTERLKDSRHFFSPKESAEICLHFLDYEACKSVIKQNISYEILAASADTEILDEIVDIMANIGAFAKTPIKINGDKIPAEIVAERFMSLNQSDIEYVLDTLRKNTTAVKNIRAYLITTLYNSKSTLNTYYQTEMQHDFYGSG